MKNEDRERRIIMDMLRHLEAGGFHPSMVYDGDIEIRVHSIAKTVESIFAVDSSRIYFREPNAGTILIVLDHDLEPGESISDWTIPADGVFGNLMDEFTQEIYREDGKYHG